MKKLLAAATLLLWTSFAFGQAVSLGDVPASSTLYVPFATFNAAGASVTASNFALADIKIYKNGSTTQRSSTTGFTLLDTDGIDFDGETGLHGFSIDLNDNTDAGFFAAGSMYWIWVSPITVDGQTVGVPPYVFTIGKDLRPATAGRSLVVDAAGLADANTVKLGPTGAGTVQTARDVGAGVNVNSWNSVLLATTNPLPNAAAGASTGLLINGTNAGTTTFGSWTLADFNVTASLDLAGGMTVAQSTSNTDAVSITGNGTGDGIQVNSGSGATGDAVKLVAASTNGNGVSAAGAGTGSGISATISSAIVNAILLGQGIPAPTTINTLASQTSFTLVAGSTDDNAYNGYGIVIRDASTAAQTALGCVRDYTGSTKTITLVSDPAIFTMAAADNVILLPAYCDAQVQQNLIDTAFLNCEVNTANFPGSATTVACKLTDKTGTSVDVSTGDLTGLELRMLSGAQQYEGRFIQSTIFDGTNHELRITLSRAMPATLVDAVTAIIR